jgi:hypothetical protein
MGRHRYFLGDLANKKSVVGFGGPLGHNLSARRASPRKPPLKQVAHASAFPLFFETA